MKPKIVVRIAGHSQKEQAQKEQAQKKQAEREQAFAIRRAVFVDEQKVPEDLEFDHIDSEAEHLLAFLDERAIGTLRLRMIDDQGAKIERVAVLAEGRGLGIGLALLREALTELRRRSCREVWLHAQTHALGFYERLGFSAYGDVFDEDGIEHQAMHMTLDENGQVSRMATHRSFVRTEGDGKG